MRIPPVFQFEITEKCNHKCSYCYNSFLSDSLEEKYDTEQIATKLSKSGAFHAIITGGEPFCVPEKLEMVASIFYNENMSFSINSNITQMDHNLLYKLKNLGLVSLLGSVMSYDKESYEKVSGVPNSYQNMKHGLSIADELNIPVVINMVLTQLNKGQVYQTGKGLYQEFGDAISSFSVTPMVPTPGKLIDLGVSSDEFKGGLKELEMVQKDFGYRIDSVNPLLPCMVTDDIERYSHFLRRSCAAGKGTFSSGVDGSIRPCSHSTEVYGNILNDDLGEILSRMTKWHDGSLIPEKCGSCDLEEKCRGGCRVAAQAVTGKLDGEHPYCADPIKKKDDENRKSIKKDIDFTNALIIIPKTEYRFRRDDDGINMLYSSRGRVSLLNDFELQLFNILRSFSGKSVDYVREQIALKDIEIEDILEDFDNKNLLKIENQD